MRIVIDIPDEIANRVPKPDRLEQRAKVAVMVALEMFDNARECLTLIEAQNLTEGSDGWRKWVSEVRATAAEERRRAERDWLATTPAGQEKQAREAARKAQRANG